MWTAVAPGALAVDAKDATFLVTGSFASKRAPGCTIWLEGDFRLDAQPVFSRDADPVRLAADAPSVEFDEGARLHVGRDTFSWSRAGWKPAR